MSYRIKSFIYFICFATAILLGYALESKTEDHTAAHTLEAPKTDLKKIGAENNLTVLSHKEE